MRSGLRILTMQFNKTAVVAMLVFLALFIIFVLHGLAKAATFCVSTAAELASGLSTAQSNGEDDVIRVVQGTYSGNFTYYASGAFNPYNLTLEGGYVTGCASRVVNPGNTVIDGGNVGTVLRLESTFTSGFVVDGFTFQNGNGSGLFVNTSGDMTITNNNIINCLGGGVLVDRASIVTLTNNTISNNTAPDRGGGGVLVEDTTAVTLANNTISSNAAYSGGGVYVNASSTTLTNNTLTNNTATNGGGGVQVYNIFDHMVTLANNTISNNTTSGSGGGFLVSGTSNLTLTNNIISNNTAAGLGGGVSIFYSGLTIIVNNTITGNAADTDGGGLLLHNYSETEQADIYNNIIWNNNAVRGADLFLNNDGNGNFIPSPVNLFNNDFDQSSPKGVYIVRPFPIDPSNLNNLDPLFVDSLNGNYHLQAGSPVINRGNNAAPALPATDKDGNSRIGDCVVYLGAFEFPGTGPGGCPVPDIQANGSDGPVTIAPGDTLKVTVALNPGSHEGTPADWWVAAATPFGFYWYTLDSWWVRSDVPIRVYGGPLFSLPSYTVLEISTLPAGAYTLYFGCDMVMNGSLDMDRLYYDQVEVNITP